MTEPAQSAQDGQADPAAPSGRAGEAGREAAHPVEPVFAPGAFLLALAGLFGTVALVPVVHPVLADRLALPAQLATGLTALAVALVGALAGVATAWRHRRLAIYELAAAGLAWAAVAAALSLQAAAGGPLPAPLAGLAGQGTLVLVLGLLGLGGLAATAVLLGSSLGYLVAGSGRVDASLSYELYVARSHLRLSPRTLLALFAVVVTGILPGLLVGLAWSLVRDAAERRAYRRGELVSRPRMPATLLMTLISIGGVSIGVWALTVVLSVMGGFTADLKTKILGQTAHGMLTAYGEDEFGDWRAVRDQVLGVRGVTGATPFLYSQVMLSSGQSVAGAVLKGIDPATVGSVLDLPRCVESGRLEWLAHPGEISLATRGEAARPAARVLPGILLGRDLARTLRAQVGDPINVLSPFGDLGPAGPQPKSRAFQVAGVFFSGMYEYDSNFAYIDLAEAQRFFGSDTVSGLELKVADLDAARATMARVVFALGGWPYKAKDWGELNRPLFAALQQERVAMAVILGFIVLVATFSILATLIMMVLEKRREIAVLKSMGAGVPSVMKIFILEGVVIGGVGALFGLLLGLGTCLLIDKVGIPLPPEIYYIDNLPVVMDGGQFVVVVLTALLLSYLATLYPATKAARLHPVDGLRSE